MPTGARIGDPDVHVLRNAGSGGEKCPLSEDPAALVTGMNGGFQALNLAVLAGAARIVLLGYDMKLGEGGRTNWHKQHRRGTPRGHYDLFRRAFRPLPKILDRLGVTVLNATPGSALDVFPMVDLESLLPDPGPAALPA